MLSQLSSLARSGIIALAALASVPAAAPAAPLGPSFMPAVADSATVKPTLVAMGEGRDKSNPAYQVWRRNGAISAADATSMGAGAISMDAVAITIAAVTMAVATITTSATAGTAAGTTATITTGRVPASSSGSAWVPATMIPTIATMAIRTIRSRSIGRA